MSRLTYVALLPLLAAAPAIATNYLTLEQAQQLMFPGETLRANALVLSPAQISEIKKASGEQPLSKDVKAWRSSDGGWFIVDEVVGKHEFITYAVALDHAGTVKHIEILDYKETYGSQIRDARWRQQFVGRAPGQSLRLGSEIKNISGATLSSKHITDGVRRLLATYEIALVKA